MSEPTVDVPFSLAAIGHACDFVANGWCDIDAYELLCQLSEARAAVAELIEAANEREEAHREVIENIPPGSECGVPQHIRERYRIACKRFDAALARVSPP
jgi:hypothetical protein